MLTTPSASDGHRKRPRSSPHTLAIMPNDFDEITTVAPKNIKVASAGIALQAFLNQPREAREAAAHVGMTGRKPHPHIAG